MATLQKVKCKVLICEEAGEIMEPHFLTALLPSVEHVISIGDHQQLRPQINNHNLSLESQQGAPYQLDRSQFERLSIGEPGRPRFPIAQLNVQRRSKWPLSSPNPAGSCHYSHEELKSICVNTSGLRRKCLTFHVYS